MIMVIIDQLNVIITCMITKLIMVIIVNDYLIIVRQDHYGHPMNTKYSKSSNPGLRSPWICWDKNLSAPILRMKKTCPVLLSVKAKHPVAAAR